MRRCEDDVKMRRCEDEKMWRWADVKMSRCEDEKMWRWEDVKMRRCEDEKMWRWEGVKMRRCEDEKVWSWEDEIETPTIGRTLRSDALGKKNQTMKQPQQLETSPCHLSLPQAWPHFIPCFVDQQRACATQRTKSAECQNKSVQFHSPSETSHVLLTKTEPWLKPLRLLGRVTPSRLWLNSMAKSQGLKTAWQGHSFQASG